MTLRNLTSPSNSNDGMSVIVGNGNPAEAIYRVYG